MSRFKLFVVSLLTLSALGAALSAAAQATPEWWVGGKVIQAPEKLGEVKVLKPIVIGSEKFSVECSAMQVTEGFIRPKNSNSASSLQFSSCKVTSRPKCGVENIKTNPMVFPLQGKTGAISLNFKPETGGTVANIVITNCPEEEIEVGEGESKTLPALTGKHEVKSNLVTGIGMICEYPKVETESKAHELDFTTTSGSEITVDGVVGTFLATVEWVLSTAKNWSAI